MKAHVAIATVQATRNSIREVSFNETVRTLSCFRVFLWWARNATIRKLKKKILKAKIPNGIDGLGVENVKTIRNKTVTRIGVDYDDISINLSPHFFMKIL